MKKGILCFVCVILFFSPVIGSFALELTEDIHMPVSSDSRPSAGEDITYDNTPSPLYLNEAALNLSSTGDVYTTQLNVQDGIVNVPLPGTASCRIYPVNTSDGEVMEIEVPENSLIYIIPQITGEASSFNDVQRMLKNNKSVIMNFPGLGLCEITEALPAVIRFDDCQAGFDDAWNTNAPLLKEVHPGWYKVYSGVRLLAASCTWIGKQMYTLIHEQRQPHFVVRPLYAASNAYFDGDTFEFLLSRKTFEDQVLSHDPRVYGTLDGVEIQGVDMVPIRGTSSNRLYNVSTGGSMFIHADTPVYVGVFNDVKLGPAEAGEKSVTRWILPGLNGISMKQAGDGSWMITDIKTGESFAIESENPFILSNLNPAINMGINIGTITTNQGVYTLAFDTNNILCAIYKDTGDSFLTEGFKFLGRDITIKCDKKVDMNPDIVFNVLEALTEKLDPSVYFIFDGIENVEVVDTIEDVRTEEGIHEVPGGSIAFRNNNTVIFTEASIQFFNSLLQDTGCSEEDVVSDFFWTFAERYLSSNSIIKNSSTDESGVAPYGYFSGNTGDNRTLLSGAMHLINKYTELFAGDMQTIEYGWAGLIPFTQLHLGGDLVQSDDGSCYWAPYGMDLKNKGPHLGFLSPNPNLYVTAEENQAEEFVTEYDMLEYMFTLANKGLGAFGALINPFDSSSPEQYNYLHQNSEGQFSYDPSYLIKLVFTAEADIRLTGFENASEFVDWIERQIAGDDGINSDSEADVFVVTMDKVRGIESMLMQSLGKGLVTNGRFPVFNEFFNRYQGLYELKEGRYFPSEVEYGTYFTLHEFLNMVEDSKSYLDHSSGKYAFRAPKPEPEYGDSFVGFMPTGNYGQEGAGVKDDPCKITEYFLFSDYLTPYYQQPYYKVVMDTENPRKMIVEYHMPDIEWGPGEKWYYEFEFEVTKPREPYVCQCPYPTGADEALWWSISLPSVDGYQLVRYELKQLKR